AADGPSAYAEGVQDVRRPSKCRNHRLKPVPLSRNFPELKAGATSELLEWHRLQPVSLSFYLTNVSIRVGRTSRPSRASNHLLTLRCFTKRTLPHNCG